jgi:serine/threonine-protein kinase
VETLQSTLSSASSVSSHATPGTLLAGKYRVVRMLGQGGMAVVVAAKHLQLRETVAVKLLHPHVLANPRSAARFLREARVTMRLRGEHVARVYDVGALEDRTPFVVMECLEGADLGALLRDRGRFAVGEAVDYVLQACEALAEAHALGVVHRDLKPANLFLTTRIDGSPCVKVLDFGISKTVVERQDDDLGSSAQLPRPFGSSDPFDETAPPSLPAPPPEVAVATTLESGDRASRVLARGETSGYGATGPAAITMTHAFLGSPKYAAPEQLLCARDVDARVDVWALGVILHELVNGAPPFQGATLEEVSESILHGKPAQFAVKDPAGLEALLVGCLAKDRADRYASMSALAAVLEPLASKEGRVSAERVVRMASSRRASEAPPPPAAVVRRAPPAKRRVRVVVAWTAPAMAAAAIAGVILAQGPWHPHASAPGEPPGEAAQAAQPGPRETVAPPAATSVASAVVLAPLPSIAPAASSARAPESKHATHAPAPRSSGSADPLGVPGGTLFDTRR